MADAAEKCSSRWPSPELYWGHTMMAGNCHQGWTSSEYTKLWGCWPGQCCDPHTTDAQGCATTEQMKEGTAWGAAALGRAKLLKGTGGMGGETEHP